jgi:hypothetical protein
MLYPIGFHVCWPPSQEYDADDEERPRCPRHHSSHGPSSSRDYAFVFASGFRKAASPASDTSTHFGSGEASAA